MQKPLVLGGQQPAAAVAPPVDNSNPYGLDANGVRQGLPLPSSPFVVPKSLTPSELKQLTALGYKPGDPIPASLPDVLQNAAAEAAAQARTGFTPPVPLSTPPLQAPKTVNLEDLPADMQAKVMKDLAAAAEQMRSFSQPGNQLPNVDPSLNRVISGNIEIVNDIGDKPKPVAQVKTAEDSGTPRDLEAPTFCRHCGWPHSEDDPTEVTDADKITYLHSLWGDPFQKDFPVFNDQLTVTLRLLRPYEVDQCHAQAHRELLRGDIAAVDYGERVQRLRASLMVVRIRSPRGVVHDLPESIDDWVASGQIASAAEDLPVAGIQRLMSTKVLTSESLHRVVSHVIIKFSGLVAKLEARYADPDFYKGIE